MQVFAGAVLNTALLRLLQATVTALVTASLAFALLRLTPGDPVEVMLGEQARPAERAALRAALGLDRPWPAQAVAALGGLLRGDLGTSLAARRPVGELIAERAGPTAALAAAALALSVALALPLGLWAGMHPGGHGDRATRVLAGLGAAAPSFVLGPLLILAFALGPPHLPPGGYRSWSALLLPALAMAPGLAALQMRLLGGGVATAAQTAAFAAARARGVGGGALWWRHALQPSLGPWIHTLGLQAAALLSGAVVAETVFAWPGIGRLLVQSVSTRDLPTVQGIVLVFALVHVAISTVADLAVAWIDPRTRQAPP